MREVTYQVVFRDGKCSEQLKDITELKVENGAYLFVCKDFVMYSVPIDIVKEVISA